MSIKIEITEQCSTRNEKKEIILTCQIYDKWEFFYLKMEGYHLEYREDPKIEKIADLLYTFDYYCGKKGITADLVILGGSGILLCMSLLHNEAFRPTRDVDVNILNASDMKLVLKVLDEVGIHVIGGVTEVPPKEDFKGEDLFEFNRDWENIRVFFPSLELLACTKIFSKRQKDLEDLRETNILEKCDIDKLLKLVEDYRPYVLNPDHPDLNLHVLSDILKEKGLKKD